MSKKKKYKYEKNYTPTRPPFVKLVNGLPKYVRVSTTKGRQHKW